MALIEENAIHDAFDGLVDGGVLENNVRAFAAQLERVFFFVPATAFWMILPTSVEPVNATLFTSG